MKLTDEDIFETAERAGFLFNKYGMVDTGRYDGELEPQLLLDFARAILKEAGVEELGRDAERYRWLRNLSKGSKHNGMFIQICKERPAPNDWVIDTIRNEAMDNAIDEAMKAK